MAVRLGSSMAPCKLFGRPLSRPPQARDSRSLIWSAAVAASAGQDLMLSQYYTSVLSQQQTSVLSQQQTSVLSQQQTSVLSQQKTSLPGWSRRLKSAACRSNRHFWNSSGADRGRPAQTGADRGSPRIWCQAPPNGPSPSTRKGQDDGS